jgi:hypothetical protein
MSQCSLLIPECVSLNVVDNMLIPSFITL